MNTGGEPEIHEKDLRRFIVEKRNVIRSYVPVYNTMLVKFCDGVNHS